MSLKDFHSDASDLSEEDEDSIASSSYLQDLNTLKIDKLSNRVTIISVMLPVLIGVVLFFIYLDIKDQVVDADISKTNQMETITRRAEEKLNALDVRIAKNRFDLDEKLPVLEKKLQSLESQTAKLIASKLDVTALDTNIARLDAALDKHDQRIRNNANQDQANVAQMERINASLQETVQKNQAAFEKTFTGLEERIASLKEPMDTLKQTLDTRLVAFQTLQKDVSLLDKQIKDVEKQIVSRKELAQRFAALEIAVEKAVADLQKNLKNPSPSSGPPLDKQSEKEATEPRDTQLKPLLDTQVPVPDTISEGTLTQ